MLLPSPSALISSSLAPQSLPAWYSSLHALSSVSSTSNSMSSSSVLTAWMMVGKEWMPLYLSCIAGASTCLGAGVVFLHPRDSQGRRSVGEGTMSFSLALAGSVMITVSVVSIGPECLQDPSVLEGEAFQFMALWSLPFLQRVVSFGVGCLLYLGLSYFAFPEPDELLGLDSQPVVMEVPVDEIEALNQEDLSVYGLSNHSTHTTEECKAKTYMRSRRCSRVWLPSDDNVSELASTVDVEESTTEQQRLPLLISDDSDDGYDKNAKALSIERLSRWSSGADLQSDQRRAWRVAMLLFVSLLFHNFPEGLAVAASALESESLGITVTIGIMIHNIPEGIAIAVPCLAARPDHPWLAFILASASGLAEPLGAFVALLLLRHVDTDVSSTQVLNMENVLAFVAGVMIMVALYELFPEANRHTQDSKVPLVAGTLSGILVMVATEYYLP